ncbi:serine/arginine repetitive matrix protein 2-like isoform X1 [Branchiostoma lanceolatum]|uniref:serine/arginine repetitive matrix protein 2-like isoform X1 n=1 Tax=Branchiostoma lanceolatum TaxID=7740 RepID=UPI0034531E91
MPPQQTQVPAHLRTPKTSYSDDFKKPRPMKQPKARPFSPGRRNNPHPRSGFLDTPNSARFATGTALLQERVRKAVRDYMHRASAEPRDDNPSDMTDTEFFSVQPKEIQQRLPNTGDHVVKKFVRPSLQYLKQQQQQQYQQPQDPEVPRVAAQARLPQYKPREKWVVVNKGPPTAPEDQPHWSTWNTRTPFHPPTAPQRHVNSVPSRPKTAPPGDFREEEQEWTTYRTVKTPPHAMTGYTAYPQSHQPIPPPDNRPVSAMTTGGQVGKFKSWAQNADDYEKQIVYDMLKSLNGGKSAGPERSQPSSMRVHVATRGTSPVRLEKSASQNRATRSAPARQRRKLAPTGANNGPPPAYRLDGIDGRVDGNPREEQILKDYMEDLEEKEYLSEIFKSSGSKGERQVEKGRSNVTIARLPANPPRWYRNQPKKSLDYTCNVSFFQHVRPPHRSHFIIAPDWTSERLTVKKRLDHMVSSSV